MKNGNGHKNGKTHHPSRLLPRHKHFADEYLKDLNATQAYLRCGYRVKNNDVAAAAAGRLLSTVKVRTYVAQRQAQIAQRLAITRERILAELAKIGFSNITDVAEFSNNGIVIRSSSELTEEQLAAVSEIAEQENGKVKIKLWSKPLALEKLGKHLGLFKDEINVTGHITMPQSFTIGDKTIEF